MVIYYTYIIYCSLLSLLSRIRNAGIGRKKLTILLGFGLLFILGLRDKTVGTDIITYLEQYHHIKYITIFETRTEAGYVILQKFLNWLDVGSQGFIFTISSIIVFILSWFLYKYSKNIGFSFFLHITVGLFAFTMSGLRQTIAISIILIAIHLAIKKKLLLFLVVVVASALFHSSAIIFIPVYFLFQIKKYSNKLMALIILSILGVGIFSELILDQIYSLSTEKYMNLYLESGEHQGTTLLFIIFSSCFPASIVILWMLDKRKINQLSHIDISFFVLSLIGFMFILLSSQLSILSRLSYYFMIGNIVAIPNTIENLTNRSLSRLSVFFFCIISILFFAIANTGGVLGIDNYSFFWNKT